MRALAAIAFWLLPLSALACEGVTSGTGLSGRFAEASFSNAAPGGARHENWIGRNARLVLHAGFDVETDEYGHGILGPLRDAKHLAIHVRQSGSSRTTCPAGVVLPEGEVFEDIAPRLFDFTGDGRPEILVVQSNARTGAKVAIYDRRGKLVADTPNIGTRNRWLAPVGIADLDGDGTVEIAYVDRPHLARTLRVWRYSGGKLVEVGALPDLTNHRIGETDIAGGIRTCGGTPEMIVATADWARIVAVRFDGSGFVIRDLGAHRGRASFARAMAC